MKRTEIINELAARGYKAEARDTIKNGVVHEGIVIRSDEIITPVIYTEPLIEDAKEYELSLADIASEVIRLYEENRTKDLNVKHLKDREYVLDHVYIGLQKVSDENLVKRNCEFEGIEEYLYVRSSNSADGFYYVKVNDGYMGSTGIDAAEIWERAEKNTFSETIIRGVAQIVAEMTGVPYDASVEADMPMYVITNKEKVKGASAILNKAAISAFFKEYKANKLIVFPSSIHEMLVVPYNPEKMSMDEMSEMVRLINAEQVAPEERLTDQAYLIEI